jgi:hypothetical protein
MAATLEELKLERLKHLQDLQRRAKKIDVKVARYYNDPLAFAADCIDWRGEGLTEYQMDIIGQLPVKKREAVRGPHGLGKSTIAAITVLWFALTRDATETDWKVVTTAGAWRQLIVYLWPEIRKWANRLKWENVRDRPFNKLELLNLNLRLTHGAATAASCTNPALIEGAHADSLLFIFDESKAIMPETFDACEGAFSGTGEALVLALSTPGAPQGRFYDIHARRPGYEDWHVRHVTLDEAIAANRISVDWARQRKTQWGETSALYLNRVLGEFHAGEEDCVIPLSWVEDAVERWHEWHDAGRTDLGGPHTVGVDVARSGEDKTVMALRWGDVITELREYAQADTMETSGRVAGILGADERMTAIVDVIGVGAGVVDRLREMDLRVQPFNAAKKSRKRDRSGELGFINVRAAAWYNLREQLDPAFGPTICLPDNDMLLGDLTAPKSGEVMSGGRIKVESKDDIKKRLGRSTDYGDAVVQAFWTQSGSWSSAYGTATCTGCGRGFLVTVNGTRRTHCPFCRTPVPMEDDEMDGEEE